MNNIHLETFIRIVEAGSFNKAAEELYITSTAIIKQINLLENDVGVQLFERTHRGLKLTKAGESLYADAKYIVTYCRDAIRRARNAMETEKSVIRIGTSPMTPAQILTDLWPKIHEHCSNLSFQIIPFENTPENAREILKNLGQNIDVVTGVFDDTLLNVRGCSGLEITKEPLCCAVSIYHPLAVRDKLTVQDLYGEELLMMHRGWSSYVDKLREELTEHHREIKIVDFDFYDVSIFNRCELEKNVLLVIKSWNCVHPMLKVIPVEWNQSIPFGVLYSTNPSETVNQFLDAVTKVIK